MGTYRKVFLAIYCENDEDLALVQKFAEEISSTFRLSARDLINLRPIVQKNGQLIGTAVRTISKEGMSGLMRMVPQLMNMKK